MSRRRQSELSEYRRSRRIVQARAGGRCECGGFNRDCPGVGSEAHHLQPRRAGDHTPGNLVWLSAACHRLVHAHPADAYRAGLLERVNTVEVS